MAIISLLSNTNMAAEMSCENTLIDLKNLVKISSDFVIEPVPDQIQQHPDLQQSLLFYLLPSVLVPPVRCT